MLIDALIFLAGVILKSIAVGFNFISFGIDDRIIEALIWVFDKIGYLNFFFPVATLMSALGVFITFLSYYYGMKLTLWVYGLIRSGTTIFMPKITESQTVNVQKDGSVNTSRRRSVSQY